MIKEIKMEENNNEEEQEEEEYLVNFITSSAISRINLK